MEANETNALISLALFRNNLLSVVSPLNSSLIYGVGGCNNGIVILLLLQHL